MRRGALWLLGSLAAIGALAALAAFADQAWLDGHPRVADALGASRLALCWCWIVPAWKSLRDAQPRLWAHAGRGALAAALLLVVLT
ncbi:MAG TPA: hypothetical protein VF943_08330 [Burkholderiales bacterium]